MRITAFISEVSTRNGVKDNKPWTMTSVTAFDVSEAPAMRLKKAITFVVPKEQNERGLAQKFKDQKVQVDLFDLEANKYGEIEWSAAFVETAATEAKAPAASGGKAA